MPILITCDDCGKKLRLSDEFAGATVECKECGAEMAVPGRARRGKPSDALGRRRARKSGSSKKSSQANGLFIAGGAAIVVVVVLALVLVLVQRPRSGNQITGAAKPSEPEAVEREVVIPPLDIDASLPPLMPFNRKKAVVKRPVGFGWNLQPDPCSAPLELKGSIPLPDVDSQIRDLRFSRRDHGRAALRVAIDEDKDQARLGGGLVRWNVLHRAHSYRRRPALAPIPCRGNWLSLLDLTQGKSIGRIDVPFPCELLAVSPKGSQVLVAPLGGQGRLDVFSADSKHVAGCRPFGDVTKPEHREIHAAVFLDEMTIAACSRNDEMVVYALPGCVPVYSIQDAGLVELSPGGRLLATTAENRIEIRDAISGDPLGSKEMREDPVALSFSPKGDQLACLTLTDNVTRLHVIPLKDGTVKKMTIPKTIGPVFWVGDHQLLVGAVKVDDIEFEDSTRFLEQRQLMLVDVRREAVLWSYNYRPENGLSFCHATVDGRVWVAGRPPRGGDQRLTATEIPQPSIAARLDDASLDALQIVTPGTKCSLQLNLPNVPEIPNFSEQVQGIAIAEAGNNGIVIQDHQPLKLVLAANLTNLQKTMTMQSMGPGTSTTASVQMKKVALRVAYEREGKTLWEAKHELSSEYITYIHFATKPAQEAVDEALWKMVINAFRQSQPPAYVFDGATTKGLGSTDLWSTFFFPNPPE